MPETMEENLLHQVRQALKFEAEVSEARIDVSVKDDCVSLSGEVPLFSRKLSAIEAVSEIPGVKDVEDHILVNPEIKKSDSDIEESIQKALVQAYETPHLNVAVACKEGKVKLWGNVPSLRQSHAAEHAAYSCEGVLSVENLLLVDPETARADADIVREVEELFANLAEEEGTLTFSINVSCVSSRLFLTGTVDSLREKLRIHNIVGQVSGLLGISSELEVR